MWAGRNRARLSRPIPYGISRLREAASVSRAHVVVPHPVVDEELPSFALLQHRLAEADARVFGRLWT